MAVSAFFPSAYPWQDETSRGSILAGWLSLIDWLSHHTSQCHTTLYVTLLHYASRDSVTLCFTWQCHTTLHVTTMSHYASHDSDTLRFTWQRYTTLHVTVLHYTSRYSVTLRFTWQCYTAQCHSTENHASQHNSVNTFWLTAGNNGLGYFDVFTYSAQPPS